MLGLGAGERKNSISRRLKLLTTFSFGIWIYDTDGLLLIAVILIELYVIRRVKSVWFLQGSQCCEYHTRQRMSLSGRDQSENLDEKPRKNRLKGK